VARDYQGLGRIVNWKQTSPFIFPEVHPPGRGEVTMTFQISEYSSQEEKMPSIPNGTATAGIEPSLVVIFFVVDLIVPRRLIGPDHVEIAG
jgi:hypothetical protein